MGYKTIPRTYYQGDLTVPLIQMATGNDVYVVKKIPGPTFNGETYSIYSFDITIPDYSDLGASASFYMMLMPKVNSDSIAEDAITDGVQLGTLGDFIIQSTPHTSQKRYLTKGGVGRFGPSVKSVIGVNARDSATGVVVFSAPTISGDYDFIILVQSDNFASNFNVATINTLDVIFKADDDYDTDSILASYGLYRSM